MMESERKPLWGRNKKKVKPRAVNVEEESEDRAAGDSYQSGKFTDLCLHAK